MSEYSDKLSLDSTDNVPSKTPRILDDKEKGTVKEAIAAVDSYTESMFTEDDLEMIFSHFEDRPFEEWLRIFREAVDYHKNDVNIPSNRYELYQSLAQGPLDGQTEDEWQTSVMFEAFLFYEWSIYPEVRAIERPPVLEEDPEDESHSIRAVTSGVLWGAAGSVIATFFEPRFPTISISSSSLQIILALSGHIMGKIPRIEMPVGFGKKIVWNTGKPWSYREQMLATLAMALTDSSPYAQDTVIAQANKYFYNFKGANSFGYMILLLLSTSLMGFGIGGIFRAVVVYPSKMIYYANLPINMLSKTLVQADVRESVNGWKLKRWEFFLLFTILFFGWYWIVYVLMNFLQLFTWMCWAAPNNLNVNAITGASSGLGLNPFPSFDPNTFGNFAGIYIPVWAYSNVMAGLCISTFAVCIMWWTNVANTGYLPINTNNLYDNEGNLWDVSQVLNPKTNKLDAEMLQNYSYPYWTAALVATYGGNFLIYPAGFMQGYLNYFPELVQGFKSLVLGLKLSFTPGNRRAIDTFNDPFSRRMQQYKEVPEWWYLIVFLGSIGMAIGTVEGWKFTDTPVWTIFLGIGLTLVFLPIVCILLARTTNSYETNVLFELIVGYALPGNGNVLLVGKAYATNFFAQALDWITNQKMAHYCGIAPRTLFFAQLSSAIVTCFVQAGILTWQLNGGIHDMCNPENKNKMTCQSTRTYFNASVMWGVIGPKRIFKTVYPKMKWCFLIGALYPIPFWVVRRFGPAAAKKLNLKKGTWVHYFISGHFLRNVDEILIVNGAITYWSPYNWSYVLVDYLTSLFFNLYIFKKWPRWWSKYAYLIYNACSNGIGWAGFFEFWATQYHHIVFVDWWGNDGYANTADMNGTAIRLNVTQDAPDGYFGPRRGHFPM